jgi:hypothetical protein
LTFILSREGQRIVAQDGGYLPLPEIIAQQELKKLERDGTSDVGPSLAYLQSGRLGFARRILII